MHKSEEKKLEGGLMQVRLLTRSHGNVYATKRPVISACQTPPMVH